MQILGVANSYASAPVNAPTSLSAVPSTTSVAISFTAPTTSRVLTEVSGACESRGSLRVAQTSSGI